MTCHATPSCETYYDVLHVKEDASYDEIRQSYRAALLQSHPDKLRNMSNTLSPCKDVEDRFMLIQKAWETLSDSRLRVIYDNKLLSLRNDVLVADDVHFDDMMVENDEEALQFYHHCRCGDVFLISGTELEQMGFQLCKDEDEISIRSPESSPGSIVLSCGSCSLRIRLLISNEQ